MREVEEIYVRSLRLPSPIKATTVIDYNGDFNVYVNANLNHDVQDRACEHELRHIYRNHFYNDLPVYENEQDAAVTLKKKRRWV
jgi:hypothetical protein